MGRKLEIVLMASIQSNHLQFLLKCIQVKVGTVVDDPNFDWCFVWIWKARFLYWGGTEVQTVVWIH